VHNPQSFQGNGLFAKSKVYRGMMILSFIIAAGTNIGWAQSLNPADVDELHRRSREQAQERQDRENQKDTFLQEKTKAIDDISLPIETISFPISILHLEGERADKFPWAQKMLDQYAGKPIGKDGIALIVKRVNNAFIARGYTTTRVTVPEQDLSTGKLKLIIIPGIIRDIRFASPDTPGIWANAFSIRSGDILNIRDLEQGLEQMKRVPSQEVDLQIAPGGQLGESDIIITVKRDKYWRMAFSLDDSGTESTGRLQSSVTYSIDNLFGSNDIFYIAVNKDAQQEDYLYGTFGNSLYYSVPYGNWTFTLNGSQNEYHQTVQGINQKFIYSGNSDTLQVTAQQVVDRGQHHKTSMEYSIIKKHSKSYINDTEIVVQRKDVTAGQIGISHRHYYGPTIMDIKLSQRWGVPWFGAQGEGNLPQGSPTTRYKLWILDASVATPMKIASKEGRYTCSLHAQYSRDVLYASDFLSIGNRYTVRGFDGEQTLAAENGWYVRNEFSIPVNKATEAYIGLDYGRVYGPSSQGLLGKEVAGTALGLRGGDKQLQYDVFVSVPIYKPTGYQTASRYYGFQLNYQL